MYCGDGDGDGGGDGGGGGDGDGGWIERMGDGGRKGLVVGGEMVPNVWEGTGRTKEDRNGQPVVLASGNVGKVKKKVKKVERDSDEEFLNDLGKKIAKIIKMASEKLKLER